MEPTKRTRNISVNLRLSENELRPIDEARKASGRSRAGEIAYRLREGAVSPEPSLFAGWPEAEAKTFETFGEAAARLLADVTLACGTQTALRDRLGFMRAALPVLLDELGASTPKGVHESYYERRTRDAVRGEFFKSASKSLGVEYAETDLARVCRALREEVAASPRRDPTARPTE